MRNSNNDGESKENRKTQSKVVTELLKYVRVVAFCCIILGLYAAVEYLLVPSGYIRFILHQVDNSEEGGYDCIVLGASHARTAIDPQILDDYGYSENAFNLSIPGENVEDSYYLLEEACANNDVKKVIFEMDYQYWCNFKEREFGDRFIYDWLPMSGIKLEYIKDNLLDKDFRTVFSKSKIYVDSWSEIKANIRTKQTDAYKNYDISSVIIKDAGGPYMGRGFFYRGPNNDSKGKYSVYAWNENNVTASVVENFKKIVNYCKDNDIELVCVTAPITPYTAINGPSRYANDYFTRLCESLDVEYIDFNLVTLDDMGRTNEEYVDWEGHMDGQCAERFSKVLALELLRREDNVNVEDDEAIVFYNSYEEYEEDLEKLDNGQLNQQDAAIGTTKYRTGTTTSGN